MSRAIYEKRRTALLIVDPYNDFMSEGGKLYAITKPTADSVGYYENMRKDATAAFNPEGMEAARVNSLLYAHATLTTTELLAALPQSADGALPELLLTREIAS